MLVDATGPRPAPDLAVLRQDLDAAGLADLDVRVSLVMVSYGAPAKVAGQKSCRDIDGPIVASRVGVQTRDDTPVTAAILAPAIAASQHG